MVNKTVFILAVISILASGQIPGLNISSDSSNVTDYDGNVYRTVKIGNQVWFKENLNSIHYSDGTVIPDVAAYNNSDSLAGIYGRLYTWAAAMKNSSVQSAQGACPCGWHIPSDGEWKTLENELGGAAVAGGKMKDTGFAHWIAPNKYATNSSGLSIFGGGEYDAHYTPNVFQALKMYAVFWTSTSRSTSVARERYLAYDTCASMIYDWYKIMKYSLRCVKDTGSVGIYEHSGVIRQLRNINILSNYPNPFNPSTIIEYQTTKRGMVTMRVYDLLGCCVAELINGEQPAGRFSVTWQPGGLHSGMYVCRVNLLDETRYTKMIYMK